MLSLNKLGFIDVLSTVHERKVKSWIEGAFLSKLKYSLIVAQSSEDKGVLLSGLLQPYPNEIRFVPVSILGILY